MQAGLAKLVDTLWNAHGYIRLLALRYRTTIVSIILFLFSVVVYEVTTYGGIRSPDSEVVFRTAEALATENHFAVAGDIEQWRGFGLPRGIDGKQYSVFGPGQAIAAAPFVWLGQKLLDADWLHPRGANVPISHAVDNGLHYALNHRAVADPQPHALRWVASQLNILITAMTVVVFWKLALLMAGNWRAALVATLAFGFATMAWAYAGTFLSEPLATLLTLSSFYLLVQRDPTFGPSGGSRAGSVAAGALLGSAVATHITAILFVPFFLAYAIQPHLTRQRPADGVAPAALFALGLVVLLALLAYYNQIRFGNPLETGRGAGPNAARFAYGVFVNPAQGLYGLLMSTNKSIFLYNPIILLGIVAWRHLHRRHRLLSLILTALLVVRLGFLATRSDWHGGFSLGPRFLVMVLPFLCLPLALAAARWFEEGRRIPLSAAAAALWLAICQQYYFSLGEVFSLYHRRRWLAEQEGSNIFSNNQIYFEWANNPLTTLLDLDRGPFLLRDLEMTNGALFVVGCVIAGIIIFAIWRLVVYSASPRRIQ
jgi:hypothetical protein